MSGLSPVLLSTQQRNSQEQDGAGLPPPHKSLLLMLPVGPLELGWVPSAGDWGCQTGAEACPLPHLPTVPTAIASSEPDQALLEGTSKGVTPSTCVVVLKS